MQISKKNLKQAGVGLTAAFLLHAAGLEIAQAYDNPGLEMSTVFWGSFFGFALFAPVEETWRENFKQMGFGGAGFFTGLTLSVALLGSPQFEGMMPPELHLPQEQIQTIEPPSPQPTAR